jgi:integrase
MQMEKIALSIVLDKRRQKLNGTYPVKMRVYCPSPRKQKLYNTIFDYSEKDFSSIWETIKPRQEHKEARRKLIALETRGNEIIESLKDFSFDTFEQAFFRHKPIDQTNIFNLFDEVVQEKLSSGAISTAEKYSLSKRCIQKYLAYKSEKGDTFPVDKINPKFLKDFSHYCEAVKSLSPATIGIYIRNLRSIYRLAMKRGTISSEMYPFGKDSFQIPTSRKINKSLSEDELKQLWQAEPANEKQAIAKDFWFFSYYSYGINTKDVCELRQDSINGNSFHYVRAKTKNTKKERVIKEVPITVSLRQIIDRRKKTDSIYLFGVLKESDNPKQKHEKIKRFNKAINKNFREFAAQAGITNEMVTKLGTYHARHSFATVAIRKGKSTALISEILHDGNLKVTENYINSFPKDAFQELSNEMEL